MKRFIPVAIGAALAATISITSPPPATAIGEDLSAMHVTASWAQCRLVKLGSALIVDSERTAMSSPNCGGRTRQDRILAF